MVLLHWIIEGLLTFLIVSISLNLNKQIPLMQLDLLHSLNGTFLIRDNFNFSHEFSMYMQQHSSNTCRWSIRLSVETMFAFIRIAFMSFVNLYRVYVTNEHWYVWFVLIADHFICLCSSWLVTMCDIWPVVGVSRVMTATCGTGPYLPSWIFVSNSSFNDAPVAQTLVSNE